MYTSEQYLNLVQLLIKRISKLHGYRVCVGAELEFYLRCEHKVIDKILKDVLEYCDRVEAEKGWDQFEIVFEKTYKIETIISGLHDAKNFLTFKAKHLEGRALFEAKPFPDDYGSAMHFHISLHDEYGENLFAAASIETNKLLQNCISGVLTLAAESVYMLCRDPKDYARFVPKFMAPTHIAWGGNNRSTIIRIPDSHPENRRIEYRLASSNNDSAVALFLALLGVSYGLEHDLEAFPRVYGNAYDEQYALKPLPKSLEVAKNLFEKEAKIANYIDKILHSKGK